MLGGFLGAGKTTSVLRLAEYLKRRGLKIGIVTNDQAAGLVDTALVENLSVPVEEIAGGCFCCKSESLVEALDRLDLKEHPDVFIAEPVGSCTDLIATVQVPLRKHYKKDFAYAPYSVIVDPYRAMQTLCVGYQRAAFSPDVNYIYRKQLEEAEIIVINKIDVVPADDLELLKARLQGEYPEARIYSVASRTGYCLSDWFNHLIKETTAPRKLMSVDYERYARGEALLGWYNSKCTISFDDIARHPGKLLQNFASEIRDTLTNQRIETAHLKIVLMSNEKAIAAVQLTNSTGAIQHHEFPDDSIIEGESNLLVNLRAEGDPELLKQCVQDCAERYSVVIVQEEAFRPSPPSPTIRSANVN